MENFHCNPDGHKDSPPPTSEIPTPLTDAEAFTLCDREGYSVGGHREYAKNGEFVEADKFRDLERKLATVTRERDEARQTADNLSGLFCNIRDTMRVRDIDGRLPLDEQVIAIAKERDRLKEQLELEQIRHSACGVIALSDTPESAAKARDMLPEYYSASAQDVARRVDECIQLRQQLQQAEAERDRLKEQLYDATACLHCDLHNESAPCSCTDEHKGRVAALKEQLQQAEADSKLANKVAFDMTVRLHEVADERDSLRAEIERQRLILTANQQIMDGAKAKLRKLRDAVEKE